MPRFFLFLRYKGTAYHGWQVQPNAITVQQILNEKLTILLKENIETTGAGRTDTGVHAREFAAHFDTEKKLQEEKDHFLYKINSLLPFDISVYDLKEVKPEAHARFDAVARSYQYIISPTKDPFSVEYAYFFPWKLNVEMMNEACEKLYEYTDFTSFSKLHTDVKTNNCRITEAKWILENDKLVFTITADRFLRNMVRAIVGTMLEVGQEKVSVSGFCEILEKKNRCLAGVSVPAHGLYLTDVRYPHNIYIL